MGLIYTDENIALIKELAAKGVKRTDIANKVGINKHSLVVKCHSLGIKLPLDKKIIFTDEVMQKVEKMLREGCKVKRIAEILEVSYPSLRSTICEKGLTKYKSHPLVDKDLIKKVQKLKSEGVEFSEISKIVDKKESIIRQYVFNKRYNPNKTGINNPYDNLIGKYLKSVIDLKHKGYSEVQICGKLEITHKEYNSIIEGYRINNVRSSDIIKVFKDLKKFKVKTNRVDNWEEITKDYNLELNTIYNIEVFHIEKDVFHFNVHDEEYKYIRYCIMTAFELKEMFKIYEKY